jgi:hypothetical protein
MQTINNCAPVHQWYTTTLPQIPANCKGIAINYSSNLARELDANSAYICYSHSSSSISCWSTKTVRASSPLRSTIPQVFPLLTRPTTHPIVCKSITIEVDTRPYVVNSHVASFPSVIHGTMTARRNLLDLGNPSFELRGRLHSKMYCSWP